MYVMSTVWEDTDDIANQYICALDIYSMIVSSYSYGIIMDSAINTHVNGNNVAYGLNLTDKRYLKEQMELIIKTASNDK